MDSRISWSGWDIVEPIGQGSFGTVYKISRDLFGETEYAALKVITIPQDNRDIEELYNDGYDEESITNTFKSYLKSIVAEYALMRKMNGSANIVNCDDVQYVQHDDGIGWDIFIKMELLTPLVKTLPANIPEETVVKLAKDMCSALKLCKKFDIVHRDIKPQNIFISPNGDFKLGDFGVAKTVEKTTGGTKVGTYKYMAPEVYNNQPYGSAADIYSLGLVLYWMLNHRRMPFVPLPPAKLAAGMDEEARMRRLSGEALPEPANGSAALKRIVLKACAYDPKNRYHSAEEMLRDLENLSAEVVNQEVFRPAPAETVLPEDRTVGAYHSHNNMPPVQSTVEDKTESVFSSHRNSVPQESPAETDRTASALFMPPPVPESIEPELPEVLPEPEPTPVAEPEIPEIPEPGYTPKEPTFARQTAKWKIPSICAGAVLVIVMLIVWLATRNPLQPYETVRGTCGEDMTWTFIGSGRLVIEGTGAMYDYYESEVPWKQYKRHIDTVYIAEGVTLIGANAFRDCSYLTNITIPNTVTTINPNAFYGCNGLTDIAFPEGVTYIGHTAFSKCKNLTQVTFPESITFIGYGSFQDCKQLSQLVWPETITINPDSNIVNVTIYDYAFEGCKKLTQLQFPYGLGSLGNNAFANCSELNYVFLPYTLFSLGEQTFANCEKLETVAIPDGFILNVTSFPEHTQFVNTIQAEGECGENLTWTLTTDGTLLIQGNGPIDTDSSPGPWFNFSETIKTVIIDTGVNYIDRYAFQGCSNLTNIVMPNSVIIIDRYAFQDCSSLEKIVIPDSVSNICDYAFQGCSSLTEVINHAHGLQIGAGAFPSHAKIINE